MEIFKPQESRLSADTQTALAQYVKGPSLRSVRNRMAKVVDKLLSDFILSDISLPESERKWPTRKTWMRDPQYLWQCDYHLIDQIAEDMDGGGRWFFNPDGMEDELSEASWPIDIGMIKICDDDDPRGEAGMPFFSRVQSVGPSEVRNKVRTLRPKMVLTSSGYLKDGCWSPQNEIFGLFGNQWVQICDGISQTSKGKYEYGQTARFGDEAKEANRSIAMASSVAFTERYEWHVAFGFHPNGPRIVLPTNPTGCLALFKNREKAEGKKRRDALKHWVNAHYRAKPQTDDEITYVREHLRGHTRFLWNGLDCELMVSAFDLEKNEFFADQAAQWRAYRKHNRVRLKKR